MELYAVLQPRSGIDNRKSLRRRHPNRGVERTWDRRESTNNESIINKIVERRILVAASAERAIDALVHWEVPCFSRDLSYQIQAILAGTRKVAVIAWRHPENGSFVRYRRPIGPDQRLSRANVAQWAAGCRARA